MFLSNNQKVAFESKHHRVWQNTVEKTKKDPYAYILSDREYSSCLNRPKRALFSGLIGGGYLYYNIRYHQELGLVKGLKLSPNFYLQTIPKLGLILFVTYGFGRSFFVDFEKRNRHKIAKIELQKFDPEWFTYDQYANKIENQLIYRHPDSKFGKNKPIAGLFDYYQEAGWINRIKSKNSDIDKEVPPKYEGITPNSPRDLEQMKKNVNKVPFLLKPY